MLPPTSPTPLPPDKVAQLTIACSGNVTAQALNGVSSVVSYTAPRVNGGQAPVASGCTPPSGSTFAVGTSTVSCSASDELAQSASCSFTVRVLPPPMIAATRFLAFGDSLTAGVIAPPLAVPISLAFANPSLSYPNRLRIALQGAYPVQSISMVNSGLPGEAAFEAVSRFQSDLVRVSPEVVLIMDGTNDVNSSGKLSASQAAAQAASAIDAMVADALGRGIDPILATIPPLRPVAGREDRAQAGLELNGMIRSIASGRAVPLVDVFTVVNQGGCSASSGVSIPCIGDDGIHPTEEAYELIAQEFFDTIVAIYDIPVSTVSATDVSVPDVSVPDVTSGQSPDETGEGEP